MFFGPTPDNVPAAVLDADYHAIVYHAPRNAGERTLWRGFRLATDAYACLMLASLVGLMVVLCSGYEPGQRLGGPIVLLLLPGALYFTANRFDIVPALLVALALTCLGRRRMLAASVFLGAATSLKVYPVLLAPLVAAYLWPRRKAILTFAGGYGLTIVVLLLPWLARSAGKRRPLRSGTSWAGLMSNTAAPSMIASCLRCWPGPRRRPGYSVWVWWCWQSRFSCGGGPPPWPPSCGPAASS